VCSEADPVATVITQEIHPSAGGCPDLLKFEDRGPVLKCRRSGCRGTDGIQREPLQKVLEHLAVTCTVRGGAVAVAHGPIGDFIGCSQFLAGCPGKCVSWGTCARAFRKRPGETGTGRERARFAMDLAIN
jgi:hypothetical protein